MGAQPGQYGQPGGMLPQQGGMQPQGMGASGEAARLVSHIFGMGLWEGTCQHTASCFWGLVSPYPAGWLAACCTVSVS